jgi:asparagine synthase (glutamine-hydrolysing)
MDFAAKPGGNVRPVKDSYAVRLHLMQMMDQGCFRKGSLAGYGVDERDPTADRRLIEFCFSLPHEQLLKDGVTRPLARTALLDRLPNTIINSAPRGLQGAGWYEILSQDEVAEHVELAAASPEASSILNVERLREMVRNWPTKNWNDDHVVEEYRRGLTIAIAAAHFVRTMRSEV